MSFILLLPAKKKRLFERMDSLKFRNKPLFAIRIPQWQMVVYSGIAIYFGLILAFEQADHPYATFPKAITVLVYEITHYNGNIINPILNRGLDDGGHVLAYLSLLMCAFFVRLKLPKNAKGFVYSLVIPAFALSVSEGSFNIFYWFVNYHLWPHPSWFVFILTNLLAVMYIFSVLIGACIFSVTQFIKTRNLLIAVGIIELYFVIWAAFGLPVTLSSIDYLMGFNLETQYYNNLVVNLTEIGQWALASFLFTLVTHPRKAFLGKEAGSKSLQKLPENNNTV